ncbi:PepSY domain-containing protein [Zavarzinia compransoris]|uniref:PepSY-associated TM helix domain-containing protein n=1 Tax=Zavarzinia marina TaxID=2911065 RepID=UPI001F164D21|nr:PepSY-associated TM helix domain-containing protein [Zavarzinia marina]MCF4164794.1 PepSY domain-containing protein [Zavarzinia marina]
MRTDVVTMYRDIHSWVGIACGLFLFTAFYAGAFTMFEGAIGQWTAPPAGLSPPPALSETPRLIAETLAARPDAAGEFRIIVTPRADLPARLVWPDHGEAAAGDEDEHGRERLLGASFAADGSLEVAPIAASGAAGFIDMLHQQVGVPLERDTALIITGIVSLLYAVALISGVIVLLPSLVKDLFKFRFGRNFKRMWLDIHNGLGLFSLPFHIVMAVTSVVFAFHDQIYDTQDVVFYDGKIQTMWSRPAVSPHPPETPLLAGDEIVARVGEQAPGFEVHTLAYRRAPDGRLVLMVWGEDPRYASRAPEGGLINVDPHDGGILDRSYLPGATDGWQPSVNTFFALHFGTFGGDVIRWNYFVLGLAGAFLIYSGNILWVDARRRRETRGGGREGRTTQALDRLTVGWMLGTMAGISLIVAVAKWLPGLGIDAAPWIEPTFFACFLGAIAWAFVRPRARIGFELFGLAAIATALVPLGSLLGLFGAAWNHPWPLWAVDAVAVAGVLFFAVHAARMKRVAVAA